MLKGTNVVLGGIGSRITEFISVATPLFDTVTV